MNESENPNPQIYATLEYLEIQKQIILMSIREIQDVCSAYRGIGPIEHRKEHVLEDVRIALDTLENN